MSVDPSTAFISYSREDLEFVKRLAQDIRNSGVKIWMDKLDIRPGDRWEAAIETAAGSCSRLIVVLSPASVASQNVLSEASFALDDGKQVIPVLYQECKVPFRLRPLQYADFRGDYATGMKDLLETLGGEPAQISAAPPSQSPQIVDSDATRKSPKAPAAPAPPPQADGESLVNQLLRRKWLVGAGGVIIIGIIVWALSSSGGSKNGSASAGQTPVATGAQSQPQTTQPQEPSELPPGISPELAQKYRDAQAGDTNAMVALGYAYQGGHGLPRDLAQAAAWFQKAADGQNANGMHELGISYREGAGVDRNDQQALYWCQKAADAADAGGMNCVAWMYEMGVGVQQDTKKAIIWYSKAAQLGNANAKVNLKRLEGTQQ